MAKRILLEPLSMVQPNKQGIYAPSRIRKAEIITAEDFRKYEASTILVSFERDNLSNPQKTVVFGRTLGCYFLAAETTLPINHTLNS